LISYQTLNNDLGLIRDYDIHTMIIDDVDPIRSPDTKTHKTIKELSAKADRVVIMNATPLQKRLFDLYWSLVPLGAGEILGQPSHFERRHIRYHYKKSLDRKTGKNVMMKNIAGYRLMEELQTKIDPYVIRRTAADIDDVDLPFLVPNHVFLDLYPSQRQKYSELQAGVIRILKEEGGVITKTRAHNAYQLGQQICGGLAVLGEADLPNSSVKFDWIENKVVDGDLSDEKVVVFMQFKPGIRAFHKRLDDFGIGSGVIWGEDNKAKQFEVQERFWRDPGMHVLLCTSAAERSLNLQISRHLIAMDTIPNPSRMNQLAGRIKRDGSSFRTVYFHSLLANDTQEERYLVKLQREQAVSDVIFNESNELYTADFSSEELLEMISG
jgi:SNF2 family DNA or RNA helicase